MYTRFSDNARAALMRANQEAQRFNHEYLGTEHILLGLIKLPDCLGCRVLKALGVSLQDVYSKVEELVGHGPERITMGKLPQTPRAKKVIEYAMEESLELGCGSVGTEHVLLGLLRENEGVAGQVLRYFDITLPQARATILKLSAAADRFPAPTDVAPLSKAWSDPISRFTDRSRKVMQLAHLAAQSFGHEQLGTEHILIGLFDEGTGVAANALKHLGFHALNLKEALLKIVPAGLPDDAPAKLPHSLRAKRVTELACVEAQQLHHNYIGTEHLLLGITRQSDCVAAQILVNLGSNLGVDLGEVRREVLSLLGHTGIDDYEIQVVQAIDAMTEDGTTDAVSAIKHAESSSPPASLFEKSSFSAAALSDRVMKMLQRDAKEIRDEHGPSTRTAILRILDASANRAAEGLRVVEDYLRFVLDDPLLTDEVKQIRHELAAAVGKLDRGQLVAARDILGDVGVEIKTDAEVDRTDAEQVVGANIHRAAQALRSLAEYAKVIEPAVAGRFETLRYQTYQLESTLAALRTGIAGLADVRLYVLVDGRASHEEFVGFADLLLTAGVDAIQLRDKKLSDRELVERGQTLRDRISRFGAKTVFIMNDRPDLAVLCNADGVHVGQDELTVADVRKIVGPRKLIGVSTHSIEQARAAVRDSANYIGVGPTFASTTKQFTDFTGVRLLAEVANEIRLPAFAIGGITLSNLDEVLASGIQRVAVSGAICNAASAAEEIKQWKARLLPNLQPPTSNP